MPIERRDGYRLWLGGPVPRGSSAMTVGSWIFMRRGLGGDRLLLRHELVHVGQYRRLGVPGFLVRYLASYLRSRARLYPHYAAYLRIPFEVEAEWQARRSFVVGDGAEENRVTTGGP